MPKMPSMLAQTGLQHAEESSETTKMASRLPKRPRICPKRAPRGIPRWPQEENRPNPEESVHVTICCNMCMFRLNGVRDGSRGYQWLPSSLQDAPRTPQDGPKTAQEGPDTAEQAPKTAQEGPNRAPKGDNSTGATRTNNN